MSRRTAPQPPRLPAQRPGPAGGKRDQNRLERVQTFCTAALPLFLTRGLEAVTVDEIVQAAGVAKGTFYRYFQDIEELVQTLLQPVAEPMRAALGDCERGIERARTADELTAVYAGLAADLAEPLLRHADLVRLYLQENRGPAVGARRPVRSLADEIGRSAVRLTEAAHRHGLLRPLDARVTALAVIGAVERLLFGFLTGEDVGDQAALPAALISMVLEGLRAG